MGREEQMLANIIGEQVKRFLINKGISLVVCVAAIYLIPDHTVMSKEEIADGVQLSKKELVIRKIFVLVAALAIKGAIRTTIDIGQLISARQKPHLLQVASLIASAPSFLITYKTIKQRIKNGSGTLNFRDLGITKNETRAAGALATAGNVATGALLYKTIADAVKQMPKG